MSSPQPTQDDPRRSLRAASFAGSPSSRSQILHRLGSPVPAIAARSPRQSFAQSTSPHGGSTPTGDMQFNKVVPSTGRKSTSSGVAGKLASSFTPSNNDGLGSPASPLESAAVSVHSMDVDNPDPEVVKIVGRHLVRDSESEPAKPDEEFDSLRLQGGDITRQLYNWTRDHEEGTQRKKRSQSISDMRGEEEPNNEIRNIKAPGGFRRNYLIQKATDPESGQAVHRPTFLTRNFIEFLSIYGHFAGEELEEEEDDEDDGSLDYDTTGADASERTPLVRRETTKRGGDHGKGSASATKAVLLLLKAFVGTGILFLPKAYLNGGLLFSSGLLLAVAILSYWCFLLLIRSKDATKVSSFGDIGGRLYGQNMRNIILASIVLSQLGFTAAYMVFTSENLQAFIKAVSGTVVSVPFLIVAQVLILLPLAMIRDIAKLSGTALIADAFILMGVLCIYFWTADTLIEHGVANVRMFNERDWSLFIGTAIFTFEGIGLVIPIQESMKKPQQFGKVLAGVMIGITVLFIWTGVFCYLAYGAEVETVVILNLPQDSRVVNVIQLLYSVAILLSSPLQLFPAIRILENGLFKRSGKYNTKIKWQKNVFRAILTIFSGFIAWGGADDLDKFVSLIGSFACIPLVFVYPPLLHYRACSKTTLSKAFDIALTIFGFVAMAYTTYQTASSWINSP